MLLCTVRDCHQHLTREARRLFCPRGHSFDVARSGYVNLLQPQDRRSKQPGDTAAAVAARRRLHDLGITAPLRDGIRELTDPDTSDSVLDVGCGEGFYLEGMPGACGVDISLPAIEAAARRYPESTWIVANADRFLPFADGAFSVALSITGRMIPAEFRRVLRPDGQLLVALAASDDLIELRGKGRDRVERTVAEFSKDFRLAGQSRVTTTADLDKAAVEDVLLSIYRPLQSQPAGAARVTFSLDLLLFRAV